MSESQEAQPDQFADLLAADVEVNEENQELTFYYQGKRDYSGKYPELNSAVKLSFEEFKKDSREFNPTSPEIAKKLLEYMLTKGPWKRPEGNDSRNLLPLEYYHYKLLLHISDPKEYAKPSLWDAPKPLKLKDFLTAAPTADLKTD